MDRIKGAGRRTSAGRHLISGTDTFSIGNLESDPNFDFINKINSQSNDDIYNNHLSFLNNDEDDSPYSLSSFECKYVDSISNSFDIKNNFIVMSVNIQSLSAKFNELCDLLNDCASNESLHDIILLQEIWQIIDADAFAITGYQPLIYRCREKGQGGGGGGGNLH
jgi:hypothetical protein